MFISIFFLLYILSSYDACLFYPISVLIIHIFFSISVSLISIYIFYTILYIKLLCLPSLNTFPLLFLNFLYYTCLFVFLLHLMTTTYCFPYLMFLSLYSVSLLKVPRYISYHSIRNHHLLP